MNILNGVISNLDDDENIPLVILQRQWVNENPVPTVLIFYTYV